MSANGNAPSNIPPDLVWNEDDPPVIFACSSYIEHNSHCDGECESQTLVSETQVDLANEARAWARAGMNYNGVPTGLPFGGIPVDLADLLVWLEVTKEVLIENDIIDEFDFDERYRHRKLEMLTRIREQFEANVRRQRVADSLGIIQRPPLLGPDGQPLG